MFIAHIFTNGERGKQMILNRIEVICSKQYKGERKRTLGLDSLYNSLFTGFSIHPLLKQ